MNIKVSIIVPVYNCEEYLERCLDSLVSQTLKDIEIILINDCSTDNSIEIINRYKEKYEDKIVMINNTENKRPGGARNAGIDKARGKYVGFVDSDDFVEKDMYEILYNLAEEKRCDLVDCGYFNDSQKRYVLSTQEDTWGELTVEKRMKLIAVPGFIWSKLIKRSVLIDNNIRFREKATYEDMDFIPYLMLFVKNIYATDIVLYNYMINDNSITNAGNDKVQIDDRMNALRYLVKLFKEAGAYETYKEALTFGIYNSYIHMIEYYVYAIDMDDVKYEDFKRLQDFFFELIDYDYSNNKFINMLDKKKRMFAELNNYDYKVILDTIKN